MLLSSMVVSFQYTMRWLMENSYALIEMSFGGQTCGVSLALPRYSDACNA